MKWRLLLPLGLCGPLLGGLTVLGLVPRGADRFAWSGVVILCAVLVARRSRERALLNGAVLGFWNGASSTLVQALWVETLVTNNPWIADTFAGQPPGFDLEFFVFMLVPFIGVAGGAMTGLLAMLAARAFDARRAGSRRGGETPP